jgi:acyl-CoA synthetase (AMP-forming)/AMP-acid ligase II
MKGYYKNETATKEMIDTDGWLHTGDIVKYDTDGFFYVESRLKEIIKSKGFQARSHSNEPKQNTQDQGCKLMKY